MPPRKPLNRVRGGRRCRFLDGACARRRPPPPPPRFCRGVGPVPSSCPDPAAPTLKGTPMHELLNDSDRELLEWVDNLTLTQGAHETPDRGACVMEAVSYIAGEQWTDHPQ